MLFYDHEKWAECRAPGAQAARSQWGTLIGSTLQQLALGDFSLFLGGVCVCFKPS